MYKDKFIESKLNLYKIVRFHSHKYARVTGGCYKVALSKILRFLANI